MLAVATMGTRGIRNGRCANVASQHLQSLLRSLDSSGLHSLNGCLSGFFKQPVRLQEQGQFRMKRSSTTLLSTMTGNQTPGLTLMGVCRSYWRGRVEGVHFGSRCWVESCGCQIKSIVICGPLHANSLSHEACSKRKESCYIIHQPATAWSYKAAALVGYLLSRASFGFA